MRSRSLVMAAGLSLLAVLTACTGDDGQADDAGGSAPTDIADAPTSTDPPQVDEPACIDEVARQPAGPDGPTVRIRAVTDEGCGPLDESLTALNWYSLDDREEYAAYSAAMEGILPAHGHGALFGGDTVEILQSPEGTPAGGGSYEHEVLALAHYSSADGFLEMLTSPDFQAVQGGQQRGARGEDYVWAMAECLHGCPEVPEVRQPDGTHVAFLFDYDPETLGDAVDVLVDDLVTGEVVYAGQVVGILEIVGGDAVLNPQNQPWGSGSLVVSVDSVDEVDALLADPALVEFRGGASEEVVAVLEAGAVS